MNSKFQALQDFIAIQSIQVPVWGFIVNILLAAFLSYILSHVYIKYGLSLSNRRPLAKNFLLLATTTTLIITIVKSSLALSLGLVGALSIVRFRAAIKEPEELMYLFLAIAIGLGFGADQRLITIVAFILIVIFIRFRTRNEKEDERQNLFLSVLTKDPKKGILREIVSILKEDCPLVNLHRMDESKEKLEASFFVDITGFDQLESTKSKLQAIDPKIQITFLDNKGIG